MEVFKHKLSLQLRFNDIDMMGHVNNAVIMEFFDYGKMKYFDETGIYVEKEDITIVIVHYEVDFMGQIFRNDVPEVCTKVSKFGNKSLEVLQHIICNGEVKAVCKTVMSGYNKRTKTSDVIPEYIKTSITKYETN
ncbi:MAG: acyl-CoA thioesterase [Bacteroidales bacterium]|jgi:acyl-CoA thioester hydrolase|nr:acyl-CoA thioesterase [Bacteroidales bacterium]